MPCCLLLFDDGPYPGDWRAQYSRQWQTGMMDAPAADPGCCILSCCCLPCANYQTRVSALGGDTGLYMCCQGYYDNACFQAGQCGDAGNPACLALEVCCCTSCAVSSTRHLVMDSRDIMPDPCDNRIIRCYNCLWELSCLCEIAGAFFPPARHASHLIEHITHLVYLTVASCMTTQTHLELNAQHQEGAAIMLNWDQVAVAQANKKAMQGGRGRRQRPVQGQVVTAAPVANPAMARGSDQPYVAMGQ